jgi:hypothetical protein
MANLRENVVGAVKWAINQEEINQQWRKHWKHDWTKLLLILSWSGHATKDCFKLKRKESQNNNNHAKSNNGNRDNQVFDSQDVAFTAITVCQKLPPMAFGSATTLVVIIVTLKKAL